MQQLHDRENLRICKNSMGVVSDFVSPGGKPVFSSTVRFRKLKKTESHEQQWHDNGVKYALLGKNNAQTGDVLKTETRSPCWCHVIYLFVYLFMRQVPGLVHVSTVGSWVNYRSKMSQLNLPRFQVFETILKYQVYRKCKAYWMVSWLT